MKYYNAHDWYWIVAGDESRVFGSVARDYLAPDDPDFVAWASDDTPPSRIDTEYNLGDVLGAYAPDIKKPKPQEIAKGYDDHKKKKQAKSPDAETLIDHEQRIAALEAAIGMTKPAPASD